jgi:excinuclease ABC subunit C
MKNDNISISLTIYLKNLTHEPGVYRMLDEHSQVLYVGKARDLNKRVNSYFSKQHHGPKVQSLVSQIASIDVYITRSETEALLLESNLIKSLRPKYNVLLRDDKSYPFIYITTSHDFPSISVKRCKKKPSSNEYFGPYPSAHAVWDAVNTFEKVFKIRNCSNSYFKSRSRPCLQYQIKRCSAPCTGFISKEDYNKSIIDATRFLKGYELQILNDLEARMQIASDNLMFEEAALIRDNIKSLRLIQEQQSVVKARGEVDVIVIATKPGFSCVQCVSIRDGEVIRSESFYPQTPNEQLLFDDEQILQQVFNAFIVFYYLDMPDRVPDTILTNYDVNDAKLLEETIFNASSVHCKIKKVTKNSSSASWIDFAINNLNLAITKHNTAFEVVEKRFKALADFLKIPNFMKMECFDISHTQGDCTVASCVVFDKHGPCKREYRRFNINNINKGDDYAAMEQVITRRYRQKIKSQALPDLIIIDGGKGQVRVARQVLKDFDLDHILVIGVAKGPSRKFGMEKIFIADEKTEITLPDNSPVLQLIAHIRDESHRFAITLHRKQRGKASIDSSIESIPGIGHKRRLALLKRFGGMRELTKASIDEIAKVKGISQDLAKLVYDHLH